jgi:hypothetical protein
VAWRPVTLVEVRFVGDFTPMIRYAGGFTLIR